MVKLINKKKFATVILDKKKKIFIVYVAILLAIPTCAMPVYLFIKA